MTVRERGSSECFSSIHLERCDPGDREVDAVVECESVRCRPLLGATGLGASYASYRNLLADIEEVGRDNTCGGGDFGLGVILTGLEGRGIGPRASIDAKKSGSYILMSVKVMSRIRERLTDDDFADEANAFNSAK